MAKSNELEQDQLYKIRHGAAHVMAQAVLELYPEAKLAIGPPIDNGFYYDFAREEPFHPEDLEAIEAKMLALAKQDIPVERSVMERDEAVAFFRDMGEEYKADIIASIPADEEISLYRQGDFIDLCRGPHRVASRPANRNVRHPQAPCYVGQSTDGYRVV